MGDKVSKELEYMVKEYDTLSTENSQLRKRVTQLEIEKKEVVESSSEQVSKLKRLASTALATLKEEKFSKGISKEAFLELEKNVIKLEKKLSEKDEYILNMR